mgnify:FL=1|tara:strand:+ start:1308 stop:1559 length:252 start_codon:yes stop_codon:yes gene_type:complete
MISLKDVEELKAKYKRVFGTDDGKAIIKDLERRFFCEVTTFSSDPHEIAYNEGQRTVVLFFQHMLSDISEKEKLINQQTEKQE